MRRESMRRRQMKLQQLLPTVTDVSVVVDNAKSHSLVLQRRRRSADTDDLALRFEAICETFGQDPRRSSLKAYPSFPSPAFKDRELRSVAVQSHATVMASFNRWACSSDPGVSSYKTGDLLEDSSEDEDGDNHGTILPPPPSLMNAHHPCRQETPDPAFVRALLASLDEGGHKNDEAKPQDDFDDDVAIPPPPSLVFESAAVPPPPPSLNHNAHAPRRQETLDPDLIIALLATLPAE
jgi:hypothetical protein